MNYWLMKSEPDVFGIQHLKNSKKQTECWDGVRNYQARNMMRDEMRVGDQAFFYHSNCKQPGIVGVMEIVKESYPDYTAWDPNSTYFDPKSTPDNPRWFMVDVKFVRCFKRLVPLQELKAQDDLRDMLILRKGNRLSITPVTSQQWQYIISMDD